jgi:hypothetical protein
LYENRARTHVAENQKRIPIIRGKQIWDGIPKVLFELLAAFLNLGYFK